MPLLDSFRRLAPGTTRSRWPLPPPNHRLESARLVLRLGQPLDWQAWRSLRENSQDFLSPWEPTWPADALTFDRFSMTLRRQWREWKDGEGYAFLIFEKTDRADEQAPADAPPAPPLRLVGAVALTHLERGAAQKAILGYWIGRTFAGRGLMSEAVGLVLDFAFVTLNLHRVEAACMPGNAPSLRLLTRLGFEEEGLARSYLRINGRWEDHILWGMIKPGSY